MCNLLRDVIIEAALLTLSTQFTHEASFITSFFGDALASPGAWTSIVVFVGLGVLFFLRGERCLVLSSVQSGQNHSLSSSIVSRPRHDRWYAFGHDSQQIRSVWWTKVVCVNTRINNRSGCKRAQINQVTKTSDSPPPSSQITHSSKCSPDSLLLLSRNSFFSIT